jgi:GNAT superfamily N-acetyltransferase
MASSVGLDLRVRPMRIDDQHFSSALHEVALAPGFFIALGPRFLRAYHRTFARSPYGVALVAECDSRPVGYLLGAVDDAAHHAFTARRHGWHLAMVASLALVTRPRLLIRFIRTRVRRYARTLLRLIRSNPPQVTRSATTTATGTLIHMAVEPTCRRSGVGQALVTTFVQVAAERGARRLRLVTRDGTNGAARFYEQLGWSRGPSMVDVDGQHWVTYTLDVA